MQHQLEGEALPRRQLGENKWCFSNSRLNFAGAVFEAKRNRPHLCDLRSTGLA